MKDASILGNLRGMLVDEIHGLRLNPLGMNDSSRSMEDEAMSNGYLCENNKLTEYTMKGYFKLYPEGGAEARFMVSGVQKIFFYCNRDGLFCQDVVKGIDDKESGYD